MAANAPPAGTWVDRWSDRILRALLWLMMRLPYTWRVPLMGRLMGRLIGPLSGYRRRARRHLAMVYPNMPPATRKRLATDVCDNFGRTLIENYSWQELGARLSDTTPTGPGVAAVAEAAASGTPVIFVTGHFGNHEAPRHVLTQMGYTIGGLYRPMANAYFNAHYAKTMSSWGGPVFAQGRQGTIGFAKHLKSGGMATLLFDVANAGGENISFLGHPARTALSAAELAIRFNAVVIPYFAVRQADGLSFDIFVEDPITHGPPIQMMQEATRRLEAQVEKHPSQWFWVHRRWKQPKSRKADAADQ
ncbi:MAG: lauroyl acyltransferase [Pseudomonadota bacterium]